MIPSLYSNGGFVLNPYGNGVELSSKYIGELYDVIDCKVTQTLGDEYTYSLEMTYPIAGEMYPYIACRMLIRAKPDITHSPQWFEIYRITTPIGGIVKIYANHISYMLASIPTPVFEETSPFYSLASIFDITREIFPHAFTATIDPASSINDSTAEMTIDTPRSARAALVGSEGSFIDTFGGELEFDNLTVTVRDRIGKEVDTVIRYGLNMTSFEQDETLTNVYTGIYPYATYSITDDSGNTATDVVTIKSNILYASDDPPYKKVKVVDLTSKFSKNGITVKPTPATLLEAAREYIAENQWGIPSVNIKVSFVSLAQTEEYRDIAGIDEVSLGDTLKIVYPAIGVSASARCVKTVYDVLAERYDNIEIGKAKRSIVTTIAEMQREIRKLRR